MLFLTLLCMLIFYFLRLASLSTIVNAPIRTRELLLGHNPTVVNHMAYVLQILCVKIRGYKTEGQRDKWDIKPAMFQCCSLNTLLTRQELCLTVRKLRPVGLTPKIGRKNDERDLPSYYD